MVDHSLIAAGDQPQDVVGGREHHQHRDQHDADSQADFLDPLAQRPA